MNGSYTASSSSEIDPSAEWVIFSWRKYAASILDQCVNVRLSRSIWYSRSRIFRLRAILIAIASALVFIAPVRWFFAKVSANTGTSSRLILPVLSSAFFRMSLASSDLGCWVIYFIQWVLISLPISNWTTLSACTERGLGAFLPVTVKPSNSPNGSSPSFMNMSSSSMGWSSSSGFSSSPFSCWSSCIGISSSFTGKPVKSSGTGASSSEESEPGIPVGGDGCKRSVSSSSGSKGGRSLSSSICTERMLVTGWLDFGFARGMRGQRRYKQVSGKNWKCVVADTNFLSMLILELPNLLIDINIA